jgi:gamma-glutamylcyclotransferase (GGCT)/AIG2-like uncharacterized protein YtfP
VDELVAFYGTLLSGLPPRPERPDLTGHLRFLSGCVIPGLLFDLGACPGLRLGGGRVVGELWCTTSTDAIRMLDAWEVYDSADELGSEYVRRKVRLLDPEVTAWVYVWNRSPDGRPRITDGDWRSHARTVR